MELGHSGTQGLFRLKHLFLPVLVIAFTGVAVTFLRPVFTMTVRWAVLATVCLVLFHSGRLTRPVGTAFVSVSLCFAAWCVCSTAWSEVPRLSLFKSIAFCAVVLGASSAGQVWVSQHRLKNCLDFLLPLLLVTLIAGIFGRHESKSVVTSGASQMYQGLVDGPNMFGAMVAMCSPLILWRLYCAWSYPRQRLVWMAVAVLALYLLIASASRGAAIVAGCSGIGLLWSFSLDKKLRFGLTGLAVALVAVMAFSNLGSLVNRYVYKTEDANQDVLYTRRLAWTKSAEQAQKGGIIGGGYGVTIGEDSFVGGLTAVGYGREKCNTQLAIIEETGLVGFGFYAVSLVVLFRCLAQSSRWRRCGGGKELTGVVSGTVVGMIGQSIFEAWWVAPGSPESLYFWALAGVAVGIASDTRTDLSAAPPVDVVWPIQAACPPGQLRGLSSRPVFR